jgi:prefoldin subunit 2
MTEAKVKQEMQAIAEKLSEIEAELDEYKYFFALHFESFNLIFSIVIEALKPLNGDRKCHRLINGVLVERSVAQVLPALLSNFDNVKGLFFTFLIVLD